MLLQTGFGNERFIFLIAFFVEFCNFSSTLTNSVFSHFEADSTTVAFDVIFRCNNGYRSDEEDSDVTTYHCRENDVTDASFQDCYGNIVKMH